MAVAVVASTEGLLSGGSTITFSHTVSAGSNFLFVGAGGGDDTEAFLVVTGITFNGDALTKSWGLDDGNFVRSEGWYLLNPDVTTANVVVTFISTPIVGYATATSFSGVHATVPLGTPATNFGSSAIASVAVTSATGELVYGFVGSDSEGSITGTGTLLLNELNMNADVSCGSQYYAGAASVTVRWDQANTGWACGGVSIKPAAASETITLDKWGPQSQPNRRVTPTMMPSGFTPPNK